MAAPLLATKLYCPPPRATLVERSRLIQHLNTGLHGKVTLIAAPAGFGKTTLVSTWLNQLAQPSAWLSLDDGDNDPARFLAYMIRALQTLDPIIGTSVMPALQSPQPPPAETLFTMLINDLSTLKQSCLLVLDDYHVINAAPIHHALAFLLDHLPPQFHIVIASREIPPMPLAKLRARGQLSELRVGDLRFSQHEATTFLNQVMGLNLAADQISLLEQRTEGWIAGLQLAALSIQKHDDASAFIATFGGQHHAIADYLLEEVLHQQPPDVQHFLLTTSMLDRMCGGLCDALLQTQHGTSQAMLEAIEQANVFVVPLDDQRQWYRYHHLFADLLRQRIQHAPNLTELHQRASAWYEANSLDVEAFHHAVAAQDVARAERLIEGHGMPLHFRGIVAPILHWLNRLPEHELDAHPSLWTVYASALLVMGQQRSSEAKLIAAERTLQRMPSNETTQDLLGRIAAIRATIAISRKDVGAIISQSQRALELLQPYNLAFRTSTHWKLGFAYEILGERDQAEHAYQDVIATAQRSGNTVYLLLAMIGMGVIQEKHSQLHTAAKTYQHVLDQVGNSPLPFVCEAHLGLSRIAYQWNDLALANQHAQQSVMLARQLDSMDRVATCDVLLAQISMAHGDMERAAMLLAQARHYAQRHDFKHTLAEIAHAQVVLSLRQGNLATAYEVADSSNNPLSHVRLKLAQGETDATLTMLAELYDQFTIKGWHDQRLNVLVLQALAWHHSGDEERAVHVLRQAMDMAESGGFIRLFVDEGEPMRDMLRHASHNGMMSAYSRKILSHFDHQIQPTQPQNLIEPLSEREIEVLRLVADGLSNHEISQQLVLAVSSVKGHNQRIFGKLQVQRRTEAIARARELGLI